MLLKGITDPKTGNTYYPHMTDAEHKRFLELRAYAESHGLEMTKPERRDGLVAIALELDGNPAPLGANDDVWPYFWIMPDGLIASAYANHPPYYPSLAQLLADHGVTSTTHEGGGEVT